MATIFEKLPASGEKCLILEPKEALVYPFNLGSYSQIRLGMAVSYTSLSDNNGQYLGESVAYDFTNNKKNMFFFGLKNSDEIPLSSNGQVFIGLIPGATNPRTAKIEAGNNCRYIQAINTFDDTVSGMISFGTGFRAGGSYSPSSASSLSLPTNVNASGSGAYASFWGMDFTFSNVGLTGQSVILSAAQRTIGSAGAISDVSITNLKSLNSSSTYLSGPSTYLTTGFSSSGGPLPLPDRIYLYSPFNNNRLRIHSILLEKYA